MKKSETYILFTYNDIYCLKNQSTVDENIIGAPKILNNFEAIKLLIFLYYSYKVIDLYLLCLIFGVTYTFASFLVSLSIFLALLSPRARNIAIAIIERAITKWEAIPKRGPKPTLKKITIL